MPASPRVTPAAAASEPAAVTPTVAAPPTPKPGPPPKGAPAPKQAVSTTPMTAGEKFKYFLSSSFKPPGPYVLSALSGMISEATDSNEKRGDASAGDFFADAATHAARSFAFRTTANFFEKFAYSTLFKQDPRYHRSNKKGFGARVMYAITRTIITQGDRNGKNEINFSYLFGGLSAAGISNLWERDEHKNISNTMGRWGLHFAGTAAGNLLKEFLGGQ